MFLSVGFSHRVSIFMAVKNFDERLYYIHACAKENWTVIELERHLRADDYHHVGALPNNFAKTLSPMTLATKAVRSFRDLSGASQHPRALQGSCSGHRRRPPRPGRARARDKKGAWLKSCRLRVDGFAEHLIQLLSVKMAERANTLRNGSRQIASDSLMVIAFYAMTNWRFTPRRISISRHTLLAFCAKNRV